MKPARSRVRQTPVADPYADETMAMVYVGDVYSLVAQEGSVAKPAADKDNVNGSMAAQDDRDDALWPLIR